jgi:hypothetical protein
VYFEHVRAIAAVTEEDAKPERIFAENSPDAWKSPAILAVLRPAANVMLI